MDNRAEEAIIRPIKERSCKEHVMPVYAYRCDNCGVQFERQQSYSEPALRICPECRKKSLKRIISPVRIVFKGSGFYSTDYRPSSASSSPAKPEVKKEGFKDEGKAAKPAKEEPAAAAKKESSD
jgi:putative FmdB family regulatory protein